MVLLCHELFCVITKKECRQIQCLSAFPAFIIRNKKTGAVGIEPTSTVLETAVLPLNYAPILQPC